MAAFGKVSELADRLRLGRLAAFFGCDEWMSGFGEAAAPPERPIMGPSPLAPQ